MNGLDISKERTIFWRRELMHCVGGGRCGRCAVVGCVCVVCEIKIEWSKNVPVFCFLTLSSLNI